MLTVVIVLAALALACAVYGWFEAGWLRTRVLEVADRRAAARRSTGSGSRTCPTSTSARRSRAATARASAPSTGSPSGGPTSSASPETSSRTRAASRGCASCSARLDDPFVVLGNHDVAVTRDPFSRAAELARPRAGSAPPRRRGRRSSSAASASRSSASIPRRYRARRARPDELVDGDAGLRILLCHFPAIVDRTPGGRVPPRARRAPARRPDLPAALPGGRITLAHPRARFVAGLYGRRRR